MTNAVEMNFLRAPESRRTARLGALFLCFVIFQFLILLQKPFLQFQFIQFFYLTFGGLFAHHLLQMALSQKDEKYASSFFSYLLDFLLLIFFMRHFSYLSSFVLVLQLFLLFIASFDLGFFKLSLLGFVLSLGASVINLSSYQAGSVQSILSLILFNLSYLSIIIVSRQLKSEFSLLQSDLTLTQKKWRSQERFAKTLIEKIPLGMAVVDRNKDLVLNNSYLTRNLNLSVAQISELIEYQRQQGVAHADVNLFSRTFNFDRTAYFDDEVEENLEVFLIKDVTEMRQLESQLRQNEKLAAVGTLAAGIAHEIRNPLAGISGSIQMLSQDSMDPTQKKLMDIVLREISRLNSLISEFLDYAKPEKIPTDSINLKTLVDEVVTSLKLQPELSPNLQWDVETRELFVVGFTEKLKQAFLNILINSVQALQKSTHPKVFVQLQQENDFAVVRIKDNGCGMSEETLKKMFEPFHTTKPKGTGLGLAITHKILDLHRAKIVVKSEIDQGTEFIIKLPVAKDGVGL